MRSSGATGKIDLSEVGCSNESFGSVMTLTDKIATGTVMSTIC